MAAQTLCVKLQLNGQTDRHQESSLVHFSLKVWHLVAIVLMNFPDNQLTKFSVFIGWCRILYPLKFLWNIAFRFPPIGWMFLTDTTDKQMKFDAVLTILERHSVSIKSNQIKISLFTWPTHEFIANWTKCNTNCSNCFYFCFRLSFYHNFTEQF